MTYNLQLATYNLGHKTYNLRLTSLTTKKMHGRILMVTGSEIAFLVPLTVESTLVTKVVY